MMHRATGQALAEDDHIRQSIADILTTPLGSRIMRREYGSMLPELIDHPGHHATRLRLQSATVMALTRWEPRIRITAVAILQEMDGRLLLDIAATKRTGQRAGQPVNLSWPLQ